jgi:hypothetical protein
MFHSETVKSDLPGQINDPIITNQNSNKLNVSIKNTSSRQILSTNCSANDEFARIIQAINYLDEKLTCLNDKITKLVPDPVLIIVCCYCNLIVITNMKNSFDTKSTFKENK